jgi:hypothetical protein
LAQGAQAGIGQRQDDTIPLQDIQIRLHKRPGNTLRRKHPPTAPASVSCGTQKLDALEPNLALVRGAAECKGVEKFTIRFPAGTTHDALGKFVDSFLVDRFEWQVIKEPYSFQPHTVVDPLQVVLAKVPNKTLQRLGALIRRRQFPAKCAGHKIIVVKDGMRFWGSMSKVWGTYLGTVFTSPQKILMAPFFPNWQMAGDKKFCERTNQWMCYFLPITHCPLPMQEQDYWHENEWAFEVEGVDDATTTVESMMDVSEGSTIKGPAADKKLAEKGTKYFKELVSEATSEECKECDDCCEWSEMHNAFVLHQVLYRMNYRARMGVAKIQDEFYKQSKWEEGTYNCSTQLNSNTPQPH